MSGKLSHLLGGGRRVSLGGMPLHNRSVKRLRSGIWARWLQLRSVPLIHTLPTGSPSPLALCCPVKHTPPLRDSTQEPGSRLQQKECSRTQAVLPRRLEASEPESHKKSVGRCSYSCTVQRSTRTPVRSTQPRGQQEVEQRRGPGPVMTDHPGQVRCATEYRLGHGVRKCIWGLRPRNKKRPSKRNYIKISKEGRASWWDVYMFKEGTSEHSMLGTRSQDHRRSTQLPRGTTQEVL